MSQPTPFHRQSSDLADRGKFGVALPDGPACRYRTSRPQLWRAPIFSALLLSFALSPEALQAGDILRGGAAAGKPPRNAVSAGGSNAGAEAAAQGRVNARDSLKRTTATLDAMKAMQAAANQAARNTRSLGINPNKPGERLPAVPNGLAVGGLKVAPKVPVDLLNPQAGEDATLWRGAKLPKQYVKSGGETVVQIQQTEQQAMLTWETFNIGKETKLVFDQSFGKANVRRWIAFNKVLDPSGRPSQILGSIEAKGQVYVINQNGIIFGGTSQVNTHSFTASALAINEGFITRGLLNNPNAEFLFYTPTISDAGFRPTAAADTYTLAQNIILGTKPNVILGGTTATKLVEGTDYQLSGGAKPTLTFTAAGLAKIGATPSTVNVTVTYMPASAVMGDVTVQAGARLTSPTNAEKVGGRISLFGTNVTNSGTISTPDGQTIIAAGRQIGISAHNSSDATLRGVDVFVGQADSRSGVAINDGLIDIPRANATIAGKDVKQLGVIDSSTSVSLSGRVDLIANYGSVSVRPQGKTGFFSPSVTGTVTLGEGSAIAIRPELESDETAVGTQLALPSLVNIEGRTIYIGKDSTIAAPGATIPTGTNAIVPVSGRTPLTAGVTINAGIFRPEASSDLGYRFVFNQGQIYVDRGALIDVAGTGDIDVPVGRNILAVQLRGAELADSPLQRNSLMRGMELNIDLRQTGTYNGQSWVGTPLGNAAGFVNLIQRGVGELTSAGGSVSLRAGESVVLQQGSTVDVSGGWINFQGGMVETTRVLLGSQLVDISQATPDQIYSGVYTGTSTFTSAKYGITETFNHPLMLNGAHYEQSYIEGKNGGSVQITAASMALDGNLRGTTIKGPRQLRTASTTSAPPKASSLNLTFESQQFNTLKDEFQAYSPTPPKVVFRNSPHSVSIPEFSMNAEGETPALSAERLATVFLSPKLLTESGFGVLNIRNPDGDFEVPAGVTLETEPGGSISMAGANIEVAGMVNAPGGELNFTTYNISPIIATQLNVQTGANGAKVPAPNADRGQFVLRAGATLTTAGLQVDDRPSSSTAFTMPFALNGGKIAINTFSADLNPGSLIDVSGGAAVSARGRTTYGSAGAISILTGQDGNLEAVIGGELLLGSTLRGFSGTKGGSLTIQAMQVQVGGSAAPGAFYLSPEFFSTGGFTKYSISGLARPTGRPEEFTPGVLIAPGTIIEPVAQNWLALPHGAADGGVVLRPELRPEGQRSPVSLAFNAPNVVDRDIFSGTLVSRGDLILGAGARIQTEAQTDPTGGVTLSGGTVAIHGSVIAPGGTIVVKGANEFATVSLAEPTQPLVTVYLGPRSLLSTAGTTVFTPNIFGHRTGVVLPGGEITVAGNIVASAGAVLDVSGASDFLDFNPAAVSLLDPLAPLVPLNSGLTAAPFQTQVVRTLRESNAGVIYLEGGEMLYTDATLLGRAGGPTALGGGLSVSSGRFRLEAEKADPRNPNLEVTQDGNTIPSRFRFKGDSPIGQAVRYSDVDALGKTVLGRGHFAVSSFAEGGFDHLQLDGTVEFAGPVTINARGSLTVAKGGVLFADRTVNLTAPYVALGQAFQTPGTNIAPFRGVPPEKISEEDFYFKPTWGTGVLNVTASLIDIGTLSLQNIRLARLHADGGDIRGNGTLNIAGTLDLRAGQIYPTTASTFNIIAYDHIVGGVVQHEGRVQITASGSRYLPLSAGGTLNIFASHIQQDGILRAPLGAINLGWDGVGASPIDPITGAGLASAGQGMQAAAVPITKSLSLGSRSVTSVSAIDPILGPIIIPYGVSVNGTTWIDPRGVDLTSGAVPQKSIKLRGDTVTTRPGSFVDIGGGGDFLAYRWVQGLGGSQDLLAQEDTFAILPNYDSIYAPYAPFSTNGSVQSSFTTYNSVTGQSVVDAGYVNNSLSVGDRIYLGETGLLPAGSYTLLPGRYGVMPGAVIVTGKGGLARGTLTMPDGSTLVGGYRFNGLNPVEQPLYSQFEVISRDQLLTRANYEVYSANAFLRNAAIQNNVAIPRLPVDSGYLLVQANQDINLFGMVRAQAPVDGRAGLIDISSKADILITGPNTSGPGVVLNAGLLSSYGAESLLIGGRREFGTNGITKVITTSGTVRVNNAGTPLQGSEIILAATEEVILDPGAQVLQKGKLKGPADVLNITSSIELSASNNLFSVSRGGSAIQFPLGTTSPTGRLTSSVNGFITRASGGAQIPIVAGVAFTLAQGDSITLSGAGTLTFTGDGSAPMNVGDGALLRVSGDPVARNFRTGVVGSTAANIRIGAGAYVAGTSVTLDSTYDADLDPLATLRGSAINLGSGQITVVMDNPGAVPANIGFVLQGAVLEKLQQTPFLSLSSYSSVDIYGSGTLQMAGGLAIHAGQIRGFNSTAPVNINATSLTLDNSTNGVAFGSPVLPGTGSELNFNSGLITLGINAMRIDQFDTVRMNAVSGGILVRDEGSLQIQGNLVGRVPVIRGVSGAKYALTALGDIQLLAPPKSSAGDGAMGATLAITGRSVELTSAIRLPSGALTVRATGPGGNVSIGSLLDVSGRAQNFHNLIRYTSAGEIRLISDQGNVNLASGGILDVSAPSGGGHAGKVTIGVPQGAFNIATGAELRGQASDGSQSGSFAIDVRSLADMAPLQLALDTGGFYESRNFRVRTGNVSIAQDVRSRHFAVSTDQGSINVSALIDASGTTGGSIELRAADSVVLQNGAILDVSGEQFSSAGKGGSVVLEAGAYIAGQAAIPTATVDIQTGSVIDLSVDAVNAPGATMTVAQAAALGRFTGTLHLRTPRTASNGVMVSTIGGTITNASHILVEGYKVYDLTGKVEVTGEQGLVDAATKTTIQTEGNAFAANISAIETSIFGGTVPANVVIAPGVEIINRTGDLTVGRDANPADDWDLSLLRFGPKQAAGVLTMRAAGDLVFNGSLSDGFDPVAANNASGNSTLWLATLKQQNALLPTNLQSWSYRLTAGADLSAADFHQTVIVTNPDTDRGSLKLGKFANQRWPVGTTPSSTTATTAAAIGGVTNGRSLFQVIRTGTGNIDISTANEVQLRNAFATIYTAGVQVNNPTTLFTDGDFTLPITTIPGTGAGIQGPGLGGNSRQQPYGTFYGLAGGDVTIEAKTNIRRIARLDPAGQIVEDSSRQLPNNWLYRRGYVDETGNFGASGTPSGAFAVNDPTASTTWWVNYSNFFQGVGALGGGDVSLIAGGDVRNVDAVIPTNARMAGRVKVTLPDLTETYQNIAPDPSKMIVLGGGNLVVQAGRNIDGGVYYVERGHGSLVAGNEIKTNETRAPSLGNLSSNPPRLPSETWLPTTLFLGDGSFDVSARGNVLLGPVANTFLLPQGLTNNYYYKTYFSTYSPTATVNVSSLGGDVTLRQRANLTGASDQSILALWLEKVSVFESDGSTAASFLPWVRVVETEAVAFETVAAINPPTLRVTAFSGDINLAGSLTLAPSPTGTIELIASGAINGLQPIGASGGTVIWNPATINLSDADPNAIPGVTTPFAYQNLVGRVTAAQRTGDILTSTGTPPAQVLARINELFAETGSYQGPAASNEVKQALHAFGPLHSGDTTPAVLYAMGGDISGLTLFSSKVTHVSANRDLTDIALYIQNANEEDISVVSAGRDILAYNTTTLLRNLATAPGNDILLPGSEGDVGANAGDIQISGPGVLEVLAGRNLDLGIGAARADGTGVGITSIGNARNISLPATGAQLVIAAGVGPMTTLGESDIDFESFLETYLNETDLSADPIVIGDLEIESKGDIDKLNAEQKALAAIEVFYRTLRDVGRAYPETGNYEAGFAAIKELFSDGSQGGQIITRARDIRTRSGGAISILAPGGGLELANTVIGNPPIPPGVVTEAGGNISIFTDRSVNIGVGRIFTLRGGNQIIWSSNGDIAAGSSSKTVQSAPPTRVVIDSQSADVDTDLAGLATGGGIGVLATVAGVAPGNVDLIAPNGAVDAGDAGIRVSGNISIAAQQILNADNIAVVGNSVGLPPAPVAVSPPSVPAGATNSSASTSSVADDVAKKNQQQAQDAAKEEPVSIFEVEVIIDGTSAPAPASAPNPAPSPDAPASNPRGPAATTDAMAEETLPKPPLPTQDQPKEEEEKEKEKEQPAPAPAPAMEQ